MCAATIHKLPAPPSRASTSSTSISESHHLIREREFPVDANLPDILSELRNSQATGTLTLNLNQGSVGTITFKERQRVDFK